ncbi:Diaminopimelate epimerase-like protein [Trametopsis cervina]|nr:Diaminopimelate epimerase-like protein [Trametopsis cervina]
MSPSQFYVVNAFATSPFGGNPAAVVFMDDLSDTNTLQNIAANFNQPATVFLKQMAPDNAQSKVVTFDVRWFTAQSELPMCGHGSIASSGLLFSTPGLIPSTVESIVYRSTAGLIITANRSGDWIELLMGAAQLQELPAQKLAKMSEVIARALGKEVKVKYAGEGIGAHTNRLFIELDPSIDLPSLQPTPQIFLETGYLDHTITTAASSNELSFISRVFAPALGNPEDQVCGSAHCMLTPYWAQKLAKADEEMAAKQVSKRGGDLRVKFHENDGLITLSGQTKLVQKGELFV